jgi:hypothetical protein
MKMEMKMEKELQDVWNRVDDDCGCDSCGCLHNRPTYKHRATELRQAFICNQ